MPPAVVGAAEDDEVGVERTRGLGDHRSWLAERGFDERLDAALDEKRHCFGECCSLPVASSALIGSSFVGELRGLPLAELYASADVFCFPSTTDAFGQVLLEAGASGLPAVAAEAGGAPELVRDGATGLLVKADDSDSFALSALAVDPELRLLLGRQAARVCGGGRCLRGRGGRRVG